MSLLQQIEVRQQAELETIVDRAVERPNHIRPDWLAATEGIAVPIESASHFTREDAARLSCAFSEAGVSELFAVATERLDNTVLYWRLPAAVDALMEFSRECSFFNFVLFPPAGNIFVLCTTDDFFIVAGPHGFVRTACGGDIARARSEFRDFVFEDRLRRVADRYEATGA